MKREIELEYMSAVAKRTRASTEKFLVAKMYGESGVRNRRRVPDIEVWSVDDDDNDDEEEEERDRDRDRNKRKIRERRKESGVKLDRKKENGKEMVKGKERKCETWADAFPDLIVADSEEDEEEVVTNRKGKAKLVEEETDSVDRNVTNFVDLTGLSIRSEEESESVRDSDESNGRFKGRKDKGDDSVGSRTELGSTSKPIVDVDETVRVSISGNGVENESGKEGSGKEVPVSSEEELGTDVSSSDTEEEDDDDDSDEDYNENMADVSPNSEYASESDSGYEEESAQCDRRREESNGVEYNDNVDCNYNASPACSDDVIILDKSFDFNENGSYAELVAAELVAEELVGGTKEKENAVVCSPKNIDKLDEKNSFTGKGYSSKSTDKGLKAKRSEDFAWIAYEEKSNFPETNDECGFSRAIEVDKKEEVSIARNRVNPDNISGNKASKTMMNHGEDRMPKEYHLNDFECTENDSTVPHMISIARNRVNPDNISGNNASKTMMDRGKDRMQKEYHLNDFECTENDSTVPHVISTARNRANLDNISGNKASKTMMDRGEDRMQKEYHSNDFECAENDFNEEKKQGVLQRKYRNEKSYKRPRSWEKINVFDVLFDTLTSKSGAVHEDIIITADIIQQEEHDELAAPKSYPMLKFTFGVKTPVQVEKTEFEQELDMLWDEFQFELRTSEIGSHTHGTVQTNKDTAFENERIHSIFCNRGEHKFTLDDEVGIKCKICSFVQLEMKYVMPDWTKFSSRRFDRRSSSDDEDLEMFDGLEFHDSKVGESRSCSKGTVWDLIPEVRDKLYPHQQDGFEFIWQNLMGTINLDELRSSTNHGMGGCIISHAPGTGKTRLTLEFLHSYLELFPGSYPLIIAPAGMLLTWEAEFKKWDVGIPFHNLNSTVLSGKEDKVTLNLLNMSKQSCDTHLVRLIKLLSWTKKKSILGLSYSLFEKLAGQRFDPEGSPTPPNNKKTRDERSKKVGKIILEKAGLLVLDEGHTPRNPRSRIYKALTNIQTKKRIILSGTPFQNNLAELFTILSFVRPDFARTISPDLKKFCQRKIRMVDVSSGRSGTEPDVDRYDRVAISQLRIKIDPFVHVHKGSVLQKSLPGLKDCVMVLNPPQYQKQLVEMIESSSYTNFEFEHKLSLVSIHPSLLQNEKDESLANKGELDARRLNPDEGVKTKFLFEMIRLSDANNEKVLVFSQYLDPLGLIMDQICSLLHWREGKEVIQLVGKVDSERRQSIINVFNDPDSSAKVLLASTKACSEGINLVGASRVVLLDVVWNPSVERQAISRAFRLGQKKVVYSYNLIVGRMEWEKYRAQTNKEHVSNLVFCSSDEPEKHSRVLSEDKILDELINHSSMEGMFDQIVYHPKDFLFS